MTARGLCRRYGNSFALSDVDLDLPNGQIHAVLGPNGAGKSTLLRILAGLVEPTSGEVRIDGRPVAGAGRTAAHQRVALIPSGDRSFYLRLSGLENLVFFARLHGMRRRDAVERSRRALAQVGLADAAAKSVGAYSHGMQKRLSVARGLLTDPGLLLVDEATHDLDPEGAATVRGLVADAARSGAAILWATQRLDEVRSFAHWVTVLSAGRIAFRGTVPQLVERAETRRYALRIRDSVGRRAAVDEALRAAVGPAGAISADGDPEHCLLTLAEHAVLGSVITALTRAGFEVLSCHEERSEIEQAFLRLTSERRP